MNNILEEKRSIVIFGQGIIGRNFHQKYFDDLNFLAYCDNDPKKHNTRCFGINVVSVDKLSDFDDFAVVVCVRKHYEVAQQLFNMGIKTFWMNIAENGFVPVFMDFSGYESLEYNPRRVCLVENPGVGGSCYAIKKFSQANDIDFVLTDSIKNIFINAYNYYAFHTSAFAVTQNMENIYNKPRIELWHGFPIKALWKASNDEKANSLVPYVEELIDNCAAMISYSKLYNNYIDNCLDNVDLSKFHITGMPRNDLLIRSNGKDSFARIFPQNANDKVVVYSPTFRNHHAYSYHSLKEGAFFAWNDYSVKKLEEFLAQNKITLLVKIHFGELSQYTIQETEHIKIINNELLAKEGIHFYELLNAADVLISDYSSIWVDFLLLEKPIIFAVRDLEDYERVHGLMVKPFDAWAPGVICKDMATLIDAINNSVWGEDTYSEKRSFVKKIMHHYCDAESVGRVVQLISTVLGREDGQIN